MKNLLIGKSFSYEIVDFTLLWQSNTYHLGGVYSIQPSTRYLVYHTFPKNAIPNFSILILIPDTALHPDHALKSPPHSRLSEQIPLIDADAEHHIIAYKIHTIHIFFCNLILKQ